MKVKVIIPDLVQEATRTLQKKGFSAYVVGGCTRDLLLGKKPADWDIATNANPEQIQELFPNTFYENAYGTVGVVNETDDETLKVLEITPFRKEGIYKDGRRPESVSFGVSLEDDLARRDFTINAIAYDPTEGVFIDPHDGESDLKKKTIRAVGNPEERFLEDHLRMLRAVRLSTQLGFSIEKKTAEAINTHAKLLEKISAERIRDEFSKLLLSERPKEGIELLHTLGLLSVFLPEVAAGLGVEQNGDHIYDVWEHNLRALQHSADRGWPLHVRLAALLHDVSKPETRRFSKEKDDWTFYGHDVVGGRVAKKICERLKYSGDDIDRVSKLVRHHLFFTDIDKITLSAVRRIVRNVGPENVWDLMKVRACDRIGMGRPKETPYRLRKYEAMIEEAMRAPVSVAKLNINGEDLVSLGEHPGPRMGFILHALLEEVLDDPEKNTKDYLVSRAKEYMKLPDDTLRALGEKGKEKKEEEEEKEVGEIRKRHWVK